MQQKELSKLLGLSPAMVSRLAKRGMPTDSLERAERWRRRHLEPGRVKGARFDPKQTANSDHAWVEVMTEQVRDLLRQLPDDANPAFSVRVWDVLTGEVQAIFPPKEDNPLCADGSPVYSDSMTPEESQAMARFWGDVAAGRWIVNKDYRPPTPDKINDSPHLTNDPALGGQ